ncbi:MAG: patatin-like phospholipase family protein [Pseudomonadota bacterium]
MSRMIASSAKGFFEKNDDEDVGDVFDPAAIGLSFSGGGYRASLFHAGALVRMNELGVMKRARLISSVSGGSIATGILAMNWDKLEFEDDVASADSIRTHFIDPVLKATSKSIDVRVGLEGLIPFWSAGNRLAAAYDRNIFDGAEINSIAAAPEFVFCATNLQTGGLFKFTRERLSDWRALHSTTKRVRLSEAVAASSAFPPVLAPIRLDLKNETVTTSPGARYKDARLRRRPVLVDGGVYDNLGLEAIWKQCGVIFSSYAGKNIAAEPKNFALDIMLPVVFRFLESSIDWRERVLISLFKNQLEDGLRERVGAYWSAEHAPKFSPGDGWLPDDLKAVFATVNDMGTRLSKFSRPEERAALTAGWLMADVRMRMFAMKDAPPPDGPSEVFSGF